jgi:predicted RNA binding protein YcfA (HicA-like mRNA interferase family)
MVTTDFSGRDIIKVLRNHGYHVVDRTGSHIKLRYEDANTGEVRNVTVPAYDRIDVDVLQNIADQCGADDFRRWCEWIERCR